jgi:2-dehydro-3-deoxyphosphooctonate aldolase (KDO 8-P synthase)
MNVATERRQTRRVEVGTATIGGGEPIVLIAGPCVVEDVGICVEIAQEAKALAEELGMGYVFKASFDKANKTIAGSYRGPGMLQGLGILEKVKSVAAVNITTDVHEPNQALRASQVADLLQVPSLLSKQIDLILAIAAAGRPVNIKKGQFTSPWEANNVVLRLQDAGYQNVLLTERGHMFGYQNLVVDMRALQVMSEFGKPVLIDASHAVHGFGSEFGGSGIPHREFIAGIVRSAVANGVDGIFLEVHPEPENAKSDAAGTFPLAELGPLLRQVKAIQDALASVHCHG